MEKNEKLPNVFTSKSPWSEATDSIWPATRFLIRRNLESHPFPSKLSSKQAQAVMDQIGIVLSPFYLLPAERVSPHQKELLFEHFILPEGFEKQGQGHAFAVDDSGKFLGIINLEDHLHLHTLSFDHSLDKAWKTLSAMETSLSKELPFAFSPRFGYLTSNPTVCGTGLLVQAFLHIPALLHLEKFAGIIETLPEEISIKGLGNEGEYLGDFILLENTYSLGVSEESIVQVVQETATKLSTAEKTARTTLDPHTTAFLKDKIARSFGLLSNACSLQIQETLSALSLIHLGKELGWIQQAKTFHFFDLFFSSRRAHLAELLHNETLAKELLPAMRAEHIRKQISSLDPCELFL